MITDRVPFYFPKLVNSDNFSCSQNTRQLWSVGPWSTEGAPKLNFTVGPCCHGVTASYYYKPFPPRNFIFFLSCPLPLLIPQIHFPSRPQILRSSHPAQPASPPATGRDDPRAGVLPPQSSLPSPPPSKPSLLGLGWARGPGREIRPGLD